MRGSDDISALPALEERCLDCEGEGTSWWLDAPESESCPTCNGSGNVPTRFGEMILALIRHNPVDAKRNSLDGSVSTDELAARRSVTVQATNRARSTPPQRPS